METGKAALINHQGVKFAVVMVKNSVMDSPSERSKAIKRLMAILRQSLFLLPYFLLDFGLFHLASSRIKPGG